MNKLILAIALSFMSQATMAMDVQIFKNASISVCGQEMGCVSMMTTEGGKSYLVDQSYAEDFLTKNGHFSRPMGSDIAVKEVMGVVVKEEGQFPNPKATIEVVKILKVIEKLY